MTTEVAFVNDIVMPVGLAVTLVTGGIAYGVTKQKVDSAHRRIDELVKEKHEHSKAMERKLDRIEKGLLDLTVAIAKISPNIHVHRRDSDESDA